MLTVVYEIRGVRLTRGTVVVAAVCALFSLGSLVVVSLLDPSAAVDPDTAAILDLNPGQARWWLLFVLLATQAVLVLGLRQWPRQIFIAMVALSVLTAWVSQDPGISLWTPTLAVAAYGVAVAVPVRQEALTLVGGGAALAAGLIGVQALQSRVSPELMLLAVLQGAVVTGAAVAVAVVVRGRRELREAREREHDAQRRAAVSQERAAMARELHDIAAHHLSGMALATAAIQRLVDTDPEQAKSAAGEVRAQTTVLLQNLRRLVGLLREDEPGETASSATVAEIGALVADVVAAGADVNLTTQVPTGVAVLGRGIGPLAQLAAYRTVQEALANSIRHAPGAACEVLVDDRAETTMTITVVNGPALTAPPVTGPGGGFGLVGMRERAALTGAELSVGPRADGGWRVSLTIPRDDLAHPDPDEETTEVAG